MQEEGLPKCDGCCSRHRSCSVSALDQRLGRLLVREKGDCDYTNGEYMLHSFLSAEFSTDFAVLLMAQGAGRVEEAGQVACEGEGGL